MKNQLFLVLFLIISKILTAQQKSDITDVTVYLDGAEINRTATININGMLVGSLQSLEGGNGYWFIVTEDIEFQFIVPDSRATE